MNSRVSGVIFRAQIYALVRRGDLAAIKLGGREQWRVERSALEEFIDRARAETAAWAGCGRLSPGSDFRVVRMRW